MQVLLTGSSGFSGCRVALYLALQKNVDKVIGVDFVPPKVFHPKLESHVVDLTDWNTYDPIKDYKPDVVIHTAADQATPYLLHANEVSMKNLLDYSGERGVEPLPPQMEYSPGLLGLLCACFVPVPKGRP